MSFLKKMFGKKDPIDEMRQLHARQDWAGLLSVAKRVDRNDLDEDLQARIAAWENEAGDALAAINLEEGLWAQKSGNLLRAREDYQLAMGQVRSAELRGRIEQALAALDSGQPPRDVDESDASPAISRRLQQQLFNGDWSCCGAPGNGSRRRSPAGVAPGHHARRTGTALHGRWNGIPPGLAGSPGR